MSRGRVLCAPEALRNAFFFFSCCLLPWLVAPYINAQAKHVLIIMEIGLGYFYVLLLRFPHTPLLGWSRLKTPIVFPLLLLLLKYYVAIAFLFFSRPKKAMSLGKNWLFCFSYNLLTQELSVKKFYDQLRKYVIFARTETILEKSLGSKTKARLYQLETIFTHRLDC